MNALLKGRVDQYHCNLLVIPLLRPRYAFLGRVQRALSKLSPLFSHQYHEVPTIREHVSAVEIIGEQFMAYRTRG